MPNLKTWVEAQLKRGYTRQQIKKALVKHGYSQTAVAEVDNISVIRKPQIKSNNKKPPYPIIFFVVVIIIIVVGVYSMSGNKGVGERQAAQIPREGLNPDYEKAMELAEREKQLLKEAGSEPVIRIVSVEELCTDFVKVENEISCEDAIGLAVEKYPGDAFEINRTQISRLVNGQPTQQDVWLVTIKVKEAIATPMGDSRDIAGIVVDQKSGETRLYKVGW